MALNNLQDSLQSKSAGMISYRAPSYGQFKTKVTPLYWYGVPRNVELGGLTMDVDLMMNYQVEESNDTEKFLAYNQAQGARMSAMEHLVPEQMFSTEENPASGISAVKALQIAGAEGQKIWTITSENVEFAISNLSLPIDIITEIRNSAIAGMEITTHERPVNFYGSSQFGYIILDPQTGAGAYKIGGGENGGDLVFSISDLFFNLSGFIFGFQEKQQAGKKASAIFKYLGKFFGGVGIVFGTIASIIDLVLSILISLISVGAGVIGFLVSNIIQSVASTVAKLMMDVVKKDSGC
ncbi:hypothetical protein [Bacterioplanoides pacificum]|uniref:Uncharacterized protein n=1 Tax=Bacterioplanoides pacificum TaxID=1171596 RepID=A0ABV7VYQ8_9GAMM